MEKIIAELRRMSKEISEEKDAAYFNMMTGKPCDPGTNDLWKKDSEDLSTIADLLENGDIEEALFQCRELDTDVREALPEGLWDMVLADDQKRRGK